MENFGAGFMVFLIIAAIIGAAVGIPIALDCKTCTEQTKEIGFPHRWGVFSGCMIEVNGSWIPLENYRFLGE